MNVFRAVGLAATVGPVATGAARAGGQAPPSDREFLTQVRAGCHNDWLKTGGLSLTAMDPAHVEADAAIWEKVVRKLRAGAMPPAGARRPDRSVVQRFTAGLEGSLSTNARSRIPIPATSRSIA